MGIIFTKTALKGLQSPAQDLLKMATRFVNKQSRFVYIN